MTYKDIATELLATLQTVLDQVDYTRGACSLSDMVAACLDARILDKAHVVIDKAKEQLK